MEPIHSRHAKSPVIKAFSKWADDGRCLFPCGIFLCDLDDEGQRFIQEKHFSNKVLVVTGIEVTKLEKLGTSHAQLVYCVVFFEALTETKILNWKPLEVKLLSPHTQLKPVENPIGKMIMVNWQREGIRMLFLWTLKSFAVRESRLATGNWKLLENQNQRIFFFERLKYQLVILPFQTLMLNSNYPWFVSLWTK